MATTKPAPAPSPKPAPPASVEEYLATFPPEVRERLEAVRATMATAVGADAGEKISYAIPLVTKDGRGVLFFAGWKKHIAIYPVPHGTPLEPELAPLRVAKDSLHLRHAAELPLDLVARLTAYVVGERS